MQIPVFKKCTLLAALFFITQFARAQLIHWTLAGSPYMIYGNMTISYGQSLLIDPGVEVVFTGNYQIRAQGPITAMGSAEAPIVFRAADTTGWWNDEDPAGGWRGIKFEASSAKDTLIYCIFRDMKHGMTSWAGMEGITTARGLYMQHCAAFHNQNVGNGSGGSVINLGNETGTEAIMEDCDIYGNTARLATIYCSGSGTATIRNCHIHDNELGDAVRMAFSDYVLIEGNEIDNNNCYATGGHSAINAAVAHATIRRNKIHHNYSESTAALHCSMGKVDIESNLIANNTHDSTWLCGYTDGGGGLHLAHNNNAPWDSTEYLVRNNVIANNYAPYNGGGLYIYNAKLKLMNNTIVNNMSKYQGAGFYVFGTISQIRAKNNVIYGNRNNFAAPVADSQSIYVAGATYLDFDYNFLEKPLFSDLGKAAGIVFAGDTLGNVIATDPLLTGPTTGIGNMVDAMQSDFSITLTSPCVNAGDSTGASPAATDYAGNQRVVGRIDIGAYETDVPSSVIDPVAPKLIVRIAPNPAHGFTMLTLPEPSGTVILHDLSGRVLRSEKHSGNRMQLRAETIPPGIYLLEWQGDKGARAMAKVIFE